MRSTRNRVLLPALILLFLLATYSAFGDEAHPKVKVLLLGNPGEVKGRILLDSEDIEVVSSYRDADVIVVCNASLNASESEEVLRLVEEGKGLVYLAGNASLSDSLISAIFKWEFKANDSQFLTGDVSDPITDQITWSSAPRVSARIVVSSPLAGSNWTTYVFSAPMDFSSRDPILVSGRLGGGRVFFFGVFLGRVNDDFMQWPYVNYLLYVLIEEAAGRSPAGYAEWRYSPVPHEREKRLFFVVPLVVLFASFWIFSLVREYSKRHPISPEKLGVFTKVMTEEERVSGWEEIGFHRQIASLLYLGLIAAVMMPLALLWGAVLYRELVKYPMVQGMIDWTVNLFNALWFVFDFGTSYALVKYLSEYRVKDPVQGIKYVQFFVWWQLLTGIVQVFIVTNLSANWVVTLDIAYMSWVFITFSLIQYPGVFMVAIFTFRGLQRFDMEQALNFTYTLIASMLLPGIFAYVFREMIVGKNLVFGSALITVVGYFLGLYLGNWLFFLGTVVLMRRMGIPVSAIFRVDFDWRVTKEVLIYGGKSMLGDFAVASVYTAQMILVARYIVNYPEWQGFYSVAMSLSWTAAWVTTFVSSVMPATSEAYSSGFRELTRVYIAETWRYGYIIMTWLVGGLLVLRRYLIYGFLGERWGPVADLLILALIFQYLGPPAWINDAIQLGTGYSGARAAFTILEQMLRLVLMVVFLAVFHMQIEGVFYAYIIALFIKDVSTSLWTHFKIVRMKILWWHTFIAPLISMLVLGGVLYLLAGAIWSAMAASSGMEIAGVQIPSGIAAAAVILFVGLLTLPMHIVLVGFLGSWNSITIRDFEKAVGLLGKLRYIMLPVLYPLKAAVRSSPLAETMKPELYELGLKEAEELMKRKLSVLKSS